MTLLNANYLVALQQVNSYIGKHYSKVLLVDNQDSKIELLEKIYNHITILIDFIMIGSRSENQVQEHSLETGNNNEENKNDQ